MAHTILVVDDEFDVEQLITQKFRREIRKEEFRFLFAHNGVEALKLLTDNPGISLILSDINMPEMDGLTLLKNVQQMSSAPHFTVIVSAYGDMENIRTAMNLGAFDFITKPIDFTDLDITIKKTISHLELQQQMRNEHDRYVALTQDLSVACAIQQSILPKVFPNRAEFELCASMTAARDIGGDFYDFFYIDDNHLALVMADVSGKGIPAAIFMAVSRTLVKATALASDGTCSCLAKANDLLCAESVDSMFVTLFYSILDIRTGQLRFANAGHNPPYVVHQDGTINALVVNHGPALGAFPDITYNEATVTIKPGDILYLYTDGVTEATNITEQFYNTERLEGMLKSCAGLSVTDVEQKILLDVKMFMAGAPQSDDITMMALRYRGV